MSAAEKLTVEHSRVLAEATLNAASFLGITAEALGNVLGRDRTSISRLKKSPVIDPESKTGELALLFVRVYRGLFAILGGNQNAMRAWLQQPNLALHGTPSSLITSVSGLSSTVQYIDAMRGKI